MFATLPLCIAGARLIGIGVSIVLILLLTSACQPIQPPTAAAPVASSSPAEGTEDSATPASAEAASIAPTPKPTRRPRVKLDIVLEKLNSVALAGNLLGDPTERKIQVVLPQGYAESNKRYPVVYMLHGYTGNESYGFEGKSIYEQVLRNGEAKEMILVFPNADNRLEGSFYLNSPTIGDYETYISQEVVDYIDAHYRTLATRDSRGIAGCSMGGDGAIHLGLTYPDVFGVAAPMSGQYHWLNDLGWKNVDGFSKLPANDDEFQTLPIEIRWLTAIAAGAAPNADKPPFFLDMPWEIVNGAPQVLPEVREKIAAASPWADAADYSKQSQRLNSLLIYHGRLDAITPVEQVRAFDAYLTELGIKHDYLETDMGHCGDLAPVLSFMSEQLVAEEP
ncbi:MAG: hypothetical protein IPK16_09955 [Anaerolineales bacterium]|nr:hypothetical protein [Anaerolineales bacterium]